MKALLIKWLLPTVIEMLIMAARSLSKKSGNTVDDQVVHVLFMNKETIIDEIKRSL